MHFRPLLDGGGLVQVLLLVFEHPLLQGPQFPHKDQPPSTAKYIKISKCSLVSVDNVKGGGGWGECWWEADANRYPINNLGVLHKKTKIVLLMKRLYFSLRAHDDYIMKPVSMIT